MMKRLWQDLTTADFAALDRARSVAILPVAAVEQHGPHLPLGTDAMINEGVLNRALARAPASLPVLALPAMPIGKSNEHADFPGTLTLSAETLIRMLTEIGESVRRAGLRKLILLNSHGGQIQVLDIVAQDLRARHAMLAVVVNAWRLMDREAAFPAAEREAGLHGGGVETALMLHLRPDLVRKDRIQDFPSKARALEKDYPTLAAGGRLGFAWQAQDLNPAGAVGDARLGTAAIGERLVEEAASRLIQIAEEMSRLPLSVIDGKV
jgi:creatinine amidohydrolase